MCLYIHISLQDKQTSLELHFLVLKLNNLIIYFLD